ncbi:MAG: hypothetical protein COA92_08735 [Sulfurovum sp.]|nr:MAG: hypothetical protein COA92_08735 [Sulfurovum sp.]
MKIVIMVLLSFSHLYALTFNDIMGNWQAVTQTNNSGTLTIEKEYLHLKADYTFSVVLSVSVQKDDAYIKDLRIEASGIWKHRDNILVIVVKQIEMPYAKEVHLISQESLTNLSNYFKDRFHKEPIRINIIKNIDKNSITLVSDKLLETVYTR